MRLQNQQGEGGDAGTAAAALSPRGRGVNQTICEAPLKPSPPGTL